MASIVFVHGVGGFTALDEWLDPLNIGLAALGAPHFDPDHDDISAVDYSSCFDATDVSTAPDTATPSTDRDRAGEEIDFQLRQQAVERAIGAADRLAKSAFAHIPNAVQEPLAQQLMRFGQLEQASHYASSATVRNAIWNLLRDHLARRHQRPLIVVAHSLGSVAIHDVIGRLSPVTTIDLLLTAGSPLRLVRFRQFSARRFPTHAVHRWLNLYSPGDVVTGGQGLSQRMHHVVDTRVEIGRTHKLQAYMSAPATAAAIAHVAFPREPELLAPPVAGAGVIARLIHPSWYSLLLSTTFTGQVEANLAGEWKRQLPLSRARGEVARRAGADIEEDAQRRRGQLAELHALGVPVAEFDDDPLADGRYPTVRDLTAAAVALLHGNLSDEGLVTAGVALLLQPLVAPFGLDVSDKERATALHDTFEVVRRPAGSTLSSRRFAEELVKSTDWARGQLTERGFPWGKVLIGSGLVVLAATGVGLAVAAPAGLAGAAAITSTLAAVGPGGMVGGVATLAGLTGTGASLAAVGVQEELRGDSSAVREARVVASGTALAAAGLDELRVALVGSLAVVHAQDQLHFASSRESVRRALQTALNHIATEFATHTRLAPDAPETKRWARKQALVKLALTVLDGIGPANDQAARAYRAIESGRAIEVGRALESDRAIESGPAIESGRAGKGRLAIEIGPANDDKGSTRD